MKKVGFQKPMLYSLITFILKNKSLKTKKLLGETSENPLSSSLLDKSPMNEKNSLTPLIFRFLSLRMPQNMICPLYPHSKTMPFWGWSGHPKRQKKKKKKKGKRKRKGFGLLGVAAKPPPRA
jgi:hypothetical protein